MLQLHLTPSQESLLPTIIGGLPYCTVFFGYGFYFYPEVRILSGLDQAVEDLSSVRLLEEIG